MHVFLSPHLDDAILSCGGIIRGLADSGEQVRIVNIMAGDPPDPMPDSPLIRELHERWEVGEHPIAVRRAEDEAAAKSLGASVRHLNIPDCVYRTANGVVLYPYGDDDLFGPVHPEDPARSALKSVRLPEMNTASDLYIPLGVGNHVDHQLVREYALSLLDQHPDTSFWFYTDFPYSRDRSKIGQAISAVQHLDLEQEMRRLTETQFEAKIHAVSLYRSQLSTFWEDLDRMRQDIRNAMSETGDGQPTEQLWLIVRS